MNFMMAKQPPQSTLWSFFPKVTGRISQQVQRFWPYVKLRNRVNNGVGLEERQISESSSMSLDIPGTQPAQSIHSTHSRRNNRPQVPSREGRAPLNRSVAVPQVSSGSGSTQSFGRQPNDSGPRELGPEGQSLHSGSNEFSIRSILDEEFQTDESKSLPSNVASDDSMGLIGRGNDQVSMASVHQLAESLDEIKLRESESEPTNDNVYSNRMIGIQRRHLARPESLPVVTEESTPSSSRRKTYTGSDESVVHHTINPSQTPIPAPRRSTSSSSSGSLSNSSSERPLHHSHSEPGPNLHSQGHTTRSGSTSAGVITSKPVFNVGPSTAKSAGNTPTDPNAQLRNIAVNKPGPGGDAPAAVGADRGGANWGGADRGGADRGGADRGGADKGQTWWGTGRKRVQLTEVLPGQDARPKEPRHKSSNTVQMPERKSPAAIPLPVTNKKPDIIGEEEAVNQHQLHMQKASLLEKNEKLEDALAATQMALYYNIQARGEHHVDVAKTHRGLARLLRKLNKYDDCVQHLEKALEIYNHCHYSVESDDLWSTHDELARAYAPIKRAKEIHHYEEAIRILKLSTDVPPERLAHMHNNVGASYHKQGEYSKAKHHLDTAKEMMEMMQSSKVDLSKVCMGLGDVYMDIGEHRKAVDEFEMLLTLCSQSSQNDTVRSLTARARKALADLYPKVGEADKVQQFDPDYEIPMPKDQPVRKAVLGSQSGVPTEWEADSMMDMALKFQNDEQFPKALYYYQQALTIYQGLTAVQKEVVLSKSAMIHNNMGNVYRSMSRFGEAKDSLTKALAVRRILYGDEPNEQTASSLFNLGYICSQSEDIGDKVQAIELHKEALEMYKKLGGPALHLKWVVALYRALASNYYSLQHTTESIKYYELAIKVINDHGGDLVQLQAIGNNVGNSYKQLKQYDKAEENLLMARNLAVMLSDADPDNHELKNDIATSENNLGCLYQEMRLPDKAVIHHRNSLETREQIKHLYAEATVDIPCSLHNLGNACVSAGCYNDAVEYYKREIEVRQNLGEDPREAMLSLSQVYDRMGRLDEATESIDRATNL